MSEIINKIITEPWPWWVGGPLIGIFVFVFLWTEGKELGISSSYQYICSRLFPLNLEYLKGSLSAGKWQTIFIAGMILGGVLLYFLIPEYSISISEDAKRRLSEIGVSDFTGYVPKELYNWNGKQLTALIIGGLLLGFGARYANGCTAGHAIVGMAKLAPSSIIATLCFFIGGLTATYLIVPLLL